MQNASKSDLLVLNLDPFNQISSTGSEGLHRWGYQKSWLSERFAHFFCGTSSWLAESIRQATKYDRKSDPLPNGGYSKVLYSLLILKVFALWGCSTYGVCVQFTRAFSAPWMLTIALLHRKPINPGFVETPGPRQRRGATHKTLLEDSQGSGNESEFIEPRVNGFAKMNGLNNVNGHTHAPARSEAKLNGHSNTAAAKTLRDYKIDSSGEYEFGGPIFVSVMMIGFPALMYYMWVGATYYDGKLPMPEPGQSISDFSKHMGSLVYEGAFPHLRAWTIYWVFFMLEGAFYLYMPGIFAKGKVLPHLGGQQLDYYCSAVWSWWATMVLAAALHVTGLFRLETIIDEFGPLMSVAIISGFAVSAAAYLSAIMRGVQHRMTGNFLYDFFMGAELNPRLFGLLDFKMFFEVRIPWFILFFVSVGGAARQYSQFGYVSGEMWFLVMAHFLYGNACAKGEQLIVTSWDMYHEKWGFMLIFWNLAGVPLSYCHCSIYLANHAPSVYHWNSYALTFLFASYLVVYWAWDTCNSQKNAFRAQERGVYVERKAFPQLPWQIVENPDYIQTSTGDSILCSGWCKFDRVLLHQ